MSGNPLRFDQLPAATTLLGPEIIPIEQVGTCSQTTVTTLLAPLNASVATANANITALQANFQTLVKGLVVNSTAAAAANTTILQSAVTAGGIVNITTPAGIIYINNTITYGSNTAMVFGPGTILQAAPGMNKTLMISTSAVNFLAGGTAVTLAQTTGSAFTVTYLSAHGLSVGQGLWLSGSTPSSYNGVFRIQTVNSTTQVTVLAPRALSAGPSGSAIAVTAVQNFKMYGGTYNYDFANNPSPPTTYQTMVINLIGLIDCSIEDVNSINGAKFAFCVNSVNHFSARNCTYNGRSDGIKVYGPAYGVSIDGLAGFALDDAISLQTKEPALYLSYQLGGGGDVYDVSVRNVSNLIGTSGETMAVYPSDNEYMDQIFIEQVSGLGSYLRVDYQTGLGYTLGNIGSLHLKNIQSVSQGANQGAIVLGGCTIDKLLIENCSFVPASSTITDNHGWMSSSSLTNIKELIVSGFKSTGSPSAAGALLMMNLAGGNFGRVVIRDAVINGTSGTQTINLVQFNGTYTLGEVSVEDSYFGAFAKYPVAFQGAPSSGTPKVTLTNNDVLGIGGIVLIPTMNARVLLRGNTFSTVSLGVVRTQGTNIVAIASDGTNDFTSSALIVVAAGSLALTLYGNDLVWDAGLLTAATKGQYFTHASSIGGRNGATQQGLASNNNGANFYALASNAGANVLIV